MKGKNSFILYKDLIHTVEKMPKDKAGELFMTILSYVNDRDPKTDDLLLELVFEPIKQQLKRDLKDWEDVLVKRSEAGKASAEAKKLAKLEAAKAKKNQQKQHASTKSTHVESVDECSTLSTVSDSVTVSDTIDDVLKQKRPSSSLFTIRDFEEQVSIGENEFSLLAVRKTNRNINELEDLLLAFVSEQKATSKLAWQTEKDARGHFMNWVNKQPKKVSVPQTFLPAN